MKYKNTRFTGCKWQSFLVCQHVILNVNKMLSYEQDFTHCIQPPNIMISFAFFWHEWLEEAQSSHALLIPIFGLPVFCYAVLS